MLINQRAIQKTPPDSSSAVRSCFVFHLLFIYWRSRSAAGAYGLLGSGFTRWHLGEGWLQLPSIFQCERFGLEAN